MAVVAIAASVSENADGNQFGIAPAMASGVVIDDRVKLDNHLQIGDNITSRSHKNTTRLRNLDGPMRHLRSSERSFGLSRRGAAERGDNNG